VLAWTVNASRFADCAGSCGGHGKSCCKREYRVLGTVVADTMWDALHKAQADTFINMLADDESVCIGDGKPPTVWQLIRDPQV